MLNFFILMGFTRGTRRKRIYLRVSEDEFNQIKQKAGTVGLGLSEYLRCSGLNQRLPPRMEPEVLEFREQIRELAGATSKMLTFALYDDRQSWIHATQELVGQIKQIVEGNIL